jgi:hypothetical protein
MATVSPGSSVPAGRREQVDFLDKGAASPLMTPDRESSRLARSVRRGPWPVTFAMLVWPSAAGENVPFHLRCVEYAADC